ncbi:MAG: STAS domain-containing protein [Planctomycetota bacterium]
MEFEVSKSDGAVVVSLSGEIVCREDQRAMTGLVDDHLEAGEQTFVVDLSRVPYVSSLGIAVLVAAYVKIDRAAGSLCLVNPRPKVTKVLEMTQVARMFRTYSSVDEALSADASP